MHLKKYLLSTYLGPLCARDKEIELCWKRQAVSNFITIQRKINWTLSVAMVVKKGCQEEVTGAKSSKVEQVFLRLKREKSLWHAWAKSNMSEIGDGIGEAVIWRTGW